MNGNNDGMMSVSISSSTVIGIRSCGYFNSTLVRRTGAWVYIG